MVKRNCLNILTFAAALLVGLAVAHGLEEKIPITTSSEEALEDFLKGRDLLWNVHRSESVEYFDKAIAKDPNFAMAHLFIAYANPSFKRQDESLEKAVSLLEQVSKGEQLWIRGFEAAQHSDPSTARKHFEELVAAYPKDAYAHSELARMCMFQQDYVKAVEEFKTATEIAPDFSGAFNLMGYAYRNMGNYVGAEKAFKKYIELMPNDPNPYDSYAELLLKMGRFDESVKQYKKALSVSPDFIESHVGIATNLILQDKPQEAREHAKAMYDAARTELQRRQALRAMMRTYVDEGQMDKALEPSRKLFARAEKAQDVSAMSVELNLMGRLRLEAGHHRRALENFDESLKLIKASDLSQEIKGAAEREYLLNTARLSLAENDLEAAKARCEKHMKQAAATKNKFEMWDSHELAGRIALQEKDYDRAIEELEHGNQLNAAVFYHMALAYEGKGDPSKAMKLFKKAAEFNALGSLDYHLIRRKAKLKLHTT